MARRIKYIILVDGSSYYDMYRLMFFDLLKDSDTMLVKDNQCRNIIKGFLLHDKIKSLIKGKLDFVFLEKNILYQEVNKSASLYDEICVIFTNASLYYNNYLEGNLLWYKRKWNHLKYVLLYLDVVDAGVSKNANYLRGHGIFDAVYTIDQADADNIGAELVMTPYSYIESMNTKPTHDLYFCGASKRRSGILAKCAAACMQHKIDATMDVVGYQNKDVLGKYTGIISLYETGQLQRYSTVLKETLRARCILEIVQPGQMALTLRAYEAVCYNHKLLTNNSLILSFPYYDPKYMQYFENVDMIDWDWVKSDTEVDYHYCGEFSPSELLKRVRDKLYR